MNTKQDNSFPEKIQNSHSTGKKHQEKLARPPKGFDVRTLYNKRA